MDIGHCEENETVHQTISLDRPVPPIRTTAAALVQVVWRIVVAIKHRRKIKHGRKWERLAEFDDRMLADIGLTRSDVARSLPLWQDWTSMHR